MIMKKLLLLLVLTLCAGATFSQTAPLWMRYPAISPDGSEIVFSYQGDLYKVKTAGGQAVPLTTHQAHDYMPVWSPDGKSIAFASDRFGNFDIYIMSASGGDVRRLTYYSGGDFPTAFTPDGKQVLFNSLRADLETYADFPNRAMPELYAVPVTGGRERMILTTPSELAIPDRSGARIYYQDRKGYEDPFRKHHRSSITRDLWVYDVKAGSHKQLTSFNGEDRNPVPDAEGKSVYYLSEESGTFNVHQLTLGTTGERRQLTSFQNHPVRYLSASASNVLCFSYDGELYTLKPGEQPRKVPVLLQADDKVNAYEIVPVNAGATEMALSPNGKEIAFVVRGEIFVTSVEGGVTKRITNTPQQERSVTFSPDGRTLLYAAERANSWDVYQSSIVRKEEPYFYASTVVKEEPVVATAAEEFQPKFSPDGKEVAYLEERTTLRVYNLASKTSRTVLPANWNYSYSDGDQAYDWSPDSKWFLVNFNPANHWISEVGLIRATGGELINLTQSGYGDDNPKWMMAGKMMIWFSERDGMKNHGSWGSQGDVYGMFFTQDAYDRFRLSEEDYKLLKEKEDREKKDKKEESPAVAKSKDPKATTSSEKSEPALVIDLKNLEDRKVRLTIHSSLLGDAAVSPDGEKLYYLARLEKGIDLWVTNLRTRETKILTKLGNNASNMELDKDGKKIFVLSDGKVTRVDAESGKKEPVTINGEMMLNKLQEQAYIFDHAWRQVLKKFYVTDLHGVKWDFYKKEYAKFLPHINNNHDFSEMLSEMLGELNASHTGCRYRPVVENGDATASLGLLIDQYYTGKGLRVAEVITKGPFDRADSRVRKGSIVEKIDHVSIDPNTNIYELLNRKEGKNTLLSFIDPASKQTWEEVIKPVSLGQENELLYQRWVANRRHEVDSLSGGKVGYIHVRGMNDPSFRVVFEEALGKHANKESLIVDTRSNGGGWLHDDLVTFLAGEKYIDMVPRGQHIGFEPQRKWTKPSAVLIGESNYSDAHMFPFAYATKAIGKTVGMPVPGTGTAVWWETQIDPTLVFGIPQVGMVGPDGKYLENTQLEPDVVVKNQYEVLIKGRDQQVEKAVELLLAQLAEKPKPEKIQSLEKKK